MASWRNWAGRKKIRFTTLFGSPTRFPNLYFLQLCVEKFRRTFAPLIIINDVDDERRRYIIGVEDNERRYAIFCVRRGINGEFIFRISIAIITFESFSLWEMVPDCTFAVRTPIIPRIGSYM